MTKLNNLTKMKQQKRQLSKRLKKGELSHEELCLHSQLKFSIRILHNKLKAIK